MSNLPWLKLYTEARTDAKLRTLTDAEHRVWFGLLCFAADQEERGTISNYDEELLAIEVCNADGALLRVTLEKLTRLRIITVQENTITFCAFARRQHIKPSDTPERVKSRVAKHRAKAKADDVTPRNALVTPRNAMKRLDKDEERDKEEELEVPLSLSGKVSLLVADAERVTAPTAAASSHNHWNDLDAKRTAEEVRRKTRMGSEDVPSLIDYLKACPLLSHELVIGEAMSYAGWLNKNRHKADARVFYNKWLKAANQQIETQRQQQQSALLNGTNGNGSVKGTSNNGTSQHEFYDPEKDEALLARKRAGARLVQELNEQQALPRVPGQM